MEELDLMEEMENENEEVEVELVDDGDELSEVEVIEEEKTDHTLAYVVGGLITTGLAAGAAWGYSKFKKNKDKDGKKKPKNKKKLMFVEVDEDGNIIVPEPKEDNSDDESEE